MILFVDASAAVSMLALEADANALFDRADRAERRIWSAVAQWETAVAFARIRQTDVPTIGPAIAILAARLDLATVPIQDREVVLALAAFAAYGKGGDQGAGLNMGDCFAYACAKANGAQLLYKGTEFARTDMAR